MNITELKKYLSTVFRDDVSITYVGEIGKEKIKDKTILKAFGYGHPYLIEFEVRGKKKSVVMETMKESIFGHEHFSDRAQVLIWQNSSFYRLPKHVKSYDVGAFTKRGELKSLGDCDEYFILTKKVEGSLYYMDLERIKNSDFSELDLKRCLALSDYLVKIHSKKSREAHLYVRRVRELIGHGECIMGIIDGYPPGLDYVDEKNMKEIEKLCIEWRYILKNKTYRLSQVHGDFHPWNILFRKGVDFTLLDRSRGEWGEPADDLASMSINYLFYSLQEYGKLEGHFETLFSQFFKNYIMKTEDYEIFKVIQPFYAWRSLVIASPLWYPNLNLDVRKKLFNFILNLLNLEEFNPEEVNCYFNGVER